MPYVVTYDIADDRRREDVATVLSGYGPRVQLSVFQCEIPTTQAAAEFLERLGRLIDPAEDQVRIYPLTHHTIRQTVVLGARVLEERQDYWIVR